MMVPSGETPPGDNSLDFVDERGQPVARFTWLPRKPGAEILRSVIPFIGIALAGFALLSWLVVRYMRTTAATIAAGEDRLRYLALHDPLCGLPNRNAFSERLEAVIAEVKAGGTTAAVFYIDLDHFKDVNDTLGHPVGDELIRVVTQRLSRMMNGEDMVARLGGDEFAVIAVGNSDHAVLDRIATRMISTLCAPYSIGGHTIVIGASIGIAAIEGNTGAADIMRYADMALYRAKNEGRNRACIYDAVMDADLSQRKLIEQDLREAIGNGELKVAYQPIFNAGGDKVLGVEALARWAHPVRGAMPPDEFIPIAEHSGLIIPLGECVLRQACIDAQAWPDIAVSVNVSPLQFRRLDFVSTIERTLSETGLDPTRLELELTESTLLGNVDNAEDAMRRLKSAGRQACARRLRHRLFEPAVSAPLPVRQAQDRQELRALDREDRRRRGHRACGCEPRPRTWHEGHGRGRGDGRAAPVPARRGRALHAGLPVRQADARKRDCRADRHPRRLSQHRRRRPRRARGLRP